MGLESIKRKIRIRNEAYKNMVGEDAAYTVRQMTNHEIEGLKREVQELCSHVDEYGCQKNLGEIPARNKWTLFVKKVLRRICCKLMGWYYFPIIEGQMEFNSQIQQIVNGFQQLMDAQQKEIDDLKIQLGKNEEEPGGSFG